MKEEACQEHVIALGVNDIYNSNMEIGSAEDVDDTLSQFFDENSNIRKFRNRFTVIHKLERDSILHFMFNIDEATGKEPIV